MLVKIDGRKVDVLDRRCAERPCFWFGFDKGTFVPGRGYTSYHKEERPVCLQRHLHGCPQKSICPECRLIDVDPPGVNTCSRCKVPTVARKEPADA